MSARPIHVVAVGEHADVVEHLQRADVVVTLLAAADVNLGTFDVAGALASIDVAEHPNAVVLGPDMDPERAISQAVDLDRLVPGIPVVVHGDLEPDALLLALRHRVRDVLGADTEAADVSSVVVSVAAPVAMVAPAAPVRHQEGKAPARVITVVSPKGGVGKTSISSNTALALAQIAPHQVVLVDLDLQFGDVDAVLDLAPERTLEDAFGLERTDSLVLKTLLTVHPAGLHVLCGAASPATNEDIGGEQVKTLIEHLSKQFAYVVIDTAGGILEPTLAALELSTDVVVVSTMDVPCIRGVRKELEVLNGLDLLPHDRHVVMNFADRESGLKIRDVEQAIGTPIDLVIPNLPQVRQATNHGQPLVLQKRGGPYAKTIRALADRITGNAADADVAHKGVTVG